MKPNFALNITDSTISLLHRTSRGWLEVGATDFDTPDLEEALGYLRASALGLSPHGITTKLVLPASQVLYTEVEAPGPDKAAREVQIRAALEGKTPYDVDDLVFDWRGTGANVQVAVVARETLEEAEGFADAHRFHPVSFVTIPPEGQFAGEPWFGTPKGARAHLAEGEKITRDQDPVRVITREIPNPAQKEPTPPEPDTAEVKAADAGGAETKADAKPETKDEAAEAASIAADENAERKQAETEAEAEAARHAEAAATATKAEAEATRHSEELARQRAEAAKAEMEIRAQNLAQAEAKRLVEEAEKTKAAMLEREKARAALIEAELQRRPAVEMGAQSEAKAREAFNGVTASGIADQGSAKGSFADTKADGAVAAAAPAPAFSSRRRDDGASAAPSLGPATAPTTAPAAKPQLPLAGGVGDAPKASGPAAPTITSITPSPGAQGGAAPIASAPVTPKGLNGTAAFVQGAKPQIAKPMIAKSQMANADGASVGKGSSAAMVTAARIPGKAAALSRFKSKDTPDVGRSDLGKPATPPARGDASMGKMGARLASRRGKPRFLGLILTLVLLAVLAAVAAWSSIYLSRNDTGPAPVQQAAVLAPAATEQTNVAQTDVAQPNEPKTNEAVGDAEAAANAEAELPPATQIANETPAQPAPAPQGVVVDAAPQTTGPARGPQSEIVLAGTDGQPPAFDVAALPTPQTRPDGAPDAAMPPPPFGTQYEFEADGRIKATPNGVVMPEGFWLIAAQPPVLPPARPAAVQTEPASAPVTLVPEPLVPAASAPVLAPPPPPRPAADAATASTAGLGQQEGNGPSSAFALDATVENRRPRGRPAGIEVPPAATPLETPSAAPPQVPPQGPAEAPADAPAQAQDDAGLDPAVPAIAQVTGLRPRARPAAVVAAAESARKAVEAASLAATAAAAARAEAASAQTVALSPRPAKRPQDFSRAVAAAVSAASRETSRRQAAAPEPASRGRAAEPEEEDEPELKVASAPRIPTRANVASQATFKNAINLSKTNLIGVYGTDNSRYALIRTSSGRYNKVRVGDRVDGGTVAAITRNELRYRKGNKMLTLAMPSG
jgi:hypothetical protein